MNRFESKGGGGGRSRLIDSRVGVFLNWQAQAVLLRQAPLLPHQSSDVSNNLFSCMIFLNGFLLFRGFLWHYFKNFRFDRVAGQSVFLKKFFSHISKLKL